MTFQEAVDLSGELRPGLVIPGHWDMFADNPGDPEAFADYLDAKYGDKIPCHIPRILEEIEL
jgi:L-ascorbate metabolism protein UlaG (beta-lactamase superfamily)